MLVPDLNLTTHLCMLCRSVPLSNLLGRGLPTCGLMPCIVIQCVCVCVVLPCFGSFWLGEGWPSSSAVQMPVGGGLGCTWQALHIHAAYMLSIHFHLMKVLDTVFVCRVAAI